MIEPTYGIPDDAAIERERERQRKNAARAPLRNPPPATLDALLMECEKHRGRIVEAMRDRQPFHPCTNANFVALLKGKKQGFYLPPLEQLWHAATVLGLPNVPSFPGEPQTALDAVAALDALIGWCRSKLPSAPTRGGPAPKTTQEDATLAGYLANHPDATEDQARDAINAALPAGANAWSLDRLRKHPTWRAHVNRRIGDYMDSDLDATVQQIADAVGYSKSTVHKSDAYQERLPARESRAEMRKEGKERERKKKLRNTLWRIARFQTGKFLKDNPRATVDELCDHLEGFTHSEAWVRAEWAEYIQSLHDTDWTRLLRSPPRGDNRLD